MTTTTKERTTNEHLAAIVAALGDGWTFIPTTACYPSGSAFGPGGRLGLWFLSATGGVPPERVRIFGEVARELTDADNDLRGSRDEPRRPDAITCAINRGPDTIAADIRRRILPALEKYLPRVKARAAQMAQDGRAATDLADTFVGEGLARYTQLSRRNPKATTYTLSWDGFSRNGVGGEVRIGHAGKGVELKLSWIEPAVALEVCRIIAEKCSGNRA